LNDYDPNTKAETPKAKPVSINSNDDLPF
jgi:hypothetical protein